MIPEIELKEFDNNIFGTIRKIKPHHNSTDIMSIQKEIKIT